MNEVGGKKKKKKESKVKEDEKGEVKKKEKEKHKKKEDLSSLGQEPNPGAMVDEKVIVAVQGAGVFSVIDEVSFILRNQIRSQENDPDSPSLRHNQQRGSPSWKQQLPTGLQMCLPRSNRPNPPRQRWRRGIGKRSANRVTTMEETVMGNRLPSGMAVT